MLRDGIFLICHHFLSENNKTDYILNEMGAKGMSSVGWLGSRVVVRFLEDSCFPHFNYLGTYSDISYVPSLFRNKKWNVPPKHFKIVHNFKSQFVFSETNLLYDSMWVINFPTIQDMKFKF